MTVPVEQWTAGDTRYLVVDATIHVRDRIAFAAAHCRSGDGEAGAATDGGHGVTACAAGDEGGDPPDRGVLFLAVESDPTPPRVVTTLVGPTGRRVVRPAAARVAAAWAARRTGAEAVMVDAPRGTLRADVADESAGRTVTVPDPRTGANASGAVAHAGDASVPHVPPRTVE